MIYLNDDFEGGLTNFYTEDQRHYIPGLLSNKIFSLRPEKGSCLVFNHHITHDGGELTRGSKYILRTEVMYRLVSNLRSHLTDDSDSDFENEGQPIIEDLL